MILLPKLIIQTNDTKYDIWRHPFDYFLIPRIWMVSYMFYRLTTSVRTPSIKINPQVERKNKRKSIIQIHSFISHKSLTVLLLTSSVPSDRLIENILFKTVQIKSSI